MLKRLLFLGAVKRNDLTLAEVAKKLGINETALNNHHKVSRYIFIAYFIPKTLFIVTTTIVKLP